MKKLKTGFVIIVGLMMMLLMVSCGNHQEDNQETKPVMATDNVSQI